MGRPAVRQPQPKRVPRPDNVSESLYEWMHSSQNSIWVMHDTWNEIIGMSDHFRDVMRPIFRKAYQILYVEGRAHTALGKSVKVHKDGSTVSGVGVDDASIDQILSDIRALHDIVALAVIVDLPLGDLSKLPAVFTKFMQLCSHVLDNPFKKDELRDLSYFITKNPIIFTDSENMGFIGKTWNLWNMMRLTFEKIVDMEELNGYIHRVLPSMSALHRVRTYKQQKKNPEQQNRKDLYGRGSSALRFVMNVQRHYQTTVRNASSYEIYLDTMTVLYDMLPICFAQMALEFWEDDTFIMHPKWTFIEFLEEPPYVLWPSRYPRGIEY